MQILVLSTMFTHGKGSREIKGKISEISGDGRKVPSKLKPDVVDINLTTWVSVWSVHMCCTCTKEADVKPYVIVQM